MAALACGIDLVEVEKLERMLRHRTGLTAAVFTEQERSECMARKHAWKHFAEHFAAKEAFLKALGLGFYPAGIASVLREVEVVCGHEKPELRVRGWLERLSGRRGFRHWRLALGETPGYAIAAVVLLPEPDGEGPPWAVSS